MKIKSSIARTTGPMTMILHLRTAFAARLLLLLLTLPAGVQAQFNYTTNDGAITITGYTGPGGAVTIPDTINGLSVTIIGNSAFNTYLGNTSPTSVTIPNSVTSIGSDAFYNCTNLASVTIGSSVTNIGDYAFAKCRKLTGVFYQGNAPTLGGPNVFWETWTATHYCLDGTTGWDTFPFTTLLWDPPTQLGYTISNGKITVRQYTGSSGAVTIPDTINGLPVISFVDDYNSFGFNTNLVSVSIGNCVTGIVSGAFQYCTRLTNAIIGNSVINIGDNAFNNCTKLTTATIPNSVSIIGQWAFSGCTNLTSITIPGSITNVGDGAFNGCSRLTNVTIGNGVTIIGNYMFSDCFSLARITIPNSVTSIGSRAFDNCTNLTSVTIGSSVTTIGTRGFSYCSGLMSLYFKGNAPAVGSLAFTGDNNATVYYLPGTTNWVSTLGGRPTVLWNPLIQTADGSLGMRTNRFGFNIVGNSNLVIVVESATNLASIAWFPLLTNTLDGKTNYFNDSRTLRPQRFYRIRSP